MPTNVDKTPVGDYYSWTKARDEGWKWNSPTPVAKTWLTFIQLNWSVSVTRGLQVVPAAYRILQVEPQEQIHISDGRVAFSVTHQIEEFLSIADEAAISDFVKALSEAVGVADTSQVFDVTKSIMESIDVADKLAVSMTKELAETIAATEVYESMIEFIRDFYSSVAVSEALVKDMVITKSHSFSISEDRKVNMLSKVFESIGLTEKYSSSWLAYIWLPDTFRFRDGDVLNFSFSKRFDEAVKFLESEKKDMIKPFADAFSIASVATTVTLFNLFFEQGLSVRDTEAKIIGLSLEDQFQILDEILRGGGEAVISDLRILTKALNDSEFEELISQTSPTGYGPFVPFIAGDYEYQEALYKVAMRARDLSRPYVNSIGFEVDVPDLFDGGTVTLPTTRTNVPFNKSFNPDEPPFLTISIKGGSGVVPLVDFDIRSDHKSFDVQLVHPTTGAGIAGTIVWKAQGY